MPLNDLYDNNSKGTLEGLAVDGVAVGLTVGVRVGNAVGEKVGVFVGEAVDGAGDGAIVGVCDGDAVVGIDVVGTTVGAAVGTS